MESYSDMESYTDMESYSAMDAYCDKESYRAREAYVNMGVQMVVESHTSMARSAEQGVTIQLKNTMRQESTDARAAH